MKFILEQPVGFSETGNRQHNEDSIYPSLRAVSSGDRLFMVCDGVGGHRKGEVASSLACTTLAACFGDSHLPASPEDLCREAIARTREVFRSTENADPQTRGMATTVTLLHFGEKGVLLAHLGDSRIYHIRSGRVLHRTSDHKWVNELVQSGVITEEQAAVHPQRNMISKVLTADRDDRPETYFTADVQPGDFFFLCTDGVLEHLYDELLTYHLRESEDLSLPDMIESIREECYGKTSDNYTAYLIRVKAVESERVIPDEKTAELVIRDEKTAEFGIPAKTGPAHDA